MPLHWLFVGEFDFIDLLLDRKTKILSSYDFWLWFLRSCLYSSCYTLFLFSVFATLILFPQRNFALVANLSTNRQISFVSTILHITVSCLHFAVCSLLGWCMQAHQEVNIILLKLSLSLSLCSACYLCLLFYFWGALQSCWERGLGAGSRAAASSCSIFQAAPKRLDFRSSSGNTVKFIVTFLAPALLSRLRPTLAWHLTDYLSCICIGLGLLNLFVLCHPKPYS